nr:hypothetical protein Iba_chr13bCG7270 [Ipomoea batatas]
MHLGSRHWAPGNTGACHYTYGDGYTGTPLALASLLPLLHSSPRPRLYSSSCPFRCHCRPSPPLCLPSSAAQSQCRLPCASSGPPPRPLFPLSPLPSADPLLHSSPRPNLYSSSCPFPCHCRPSPPLCLPSSVAQSQRRVLCASSVEIHLEHPCSHRRLPGYLKPRIQMMTKEDYLLELTKDQKFFQKMWMMERKAYFENSNQFSSFHLPHNSIPAPQIPQKVEVEETVENRYV